MDYLAGVIAERRLSLREVAERTGVSHATLSQVINGKTIPSPPTLKLIADGLGLDYINLMRLAGHLPLTERDYNDAALELARIYASLPADAQETIRRLLLVLREQYGASDKTGKR